jgi:hypothetical protein
MREGPTQSTAKKPRKNVWAPSIQVSSSLPDRKRRIRSMWPLFENVFCWSSSNNSMLRGLGPLSEIITDLFVADAAGDRQGRHQTRWRKTQTIEVERCIDCERVSIGSCEIGAGQPAAHVTPLFRRTGSTKPEW